MSRTAKRAAVIAFVLFGLGTSGLVCQRIAARGRYAVPYSTYGAGPGGAKALYLYAEEAGLGPVRWVQDLSGLPEEGLLIAIGGCEQAPNRALSRYEAAELSEWIEGGGVLLVAGAHDYLWDDAGVALDAPAGCVPEGSLARELARAERGEERGEELAEDFADDPEALVDRLLGDEDVQPPTLATGTGVLAGLGPIPLARPGTIRAGADAQTILLGGKSSTPQGVFVPRGEGAIVVISSASLFQNRHLAGADGGVVFARLAGDLAANGPVLFDEYHLGVGARRSLGQYVREVGGGPLAAQLLVVVAFALLAFGVRFGRPVTEVPPVPGGTASYVEGVGDLYARTKDAPAALSLVVQHGLAEVAAHHHLDGTSGERLEALLRERGRRDEAGAVGALRALTALDELSGRQLVQRVREIDGLVARAKGNPG